MSKLEQSAYFRSLVSKSALIAGVLFLPVMFVGFLLTNPHGFNESKALFYFGAFLLLPWFLSEVLAPYGVASLVVIGVLQFLWVFTWVTGLRYLYMRFPAGKAGIGL